MTIDRSEPYDEAARKEVLISLGDNRWQCPATKLVLIPTTNETMWRVYKVRHRSPLNPLRRTGNPDKRWSRFDIAGHATLYGASTQRGSYIEALAYARMRPHSIPFHEMFSDLAPEDDPIADEWAEQSHMRPGHIPWQWRSERKLAELLLAKDDYYIDLSAADTLGALRRSAGEWAPLEYQADPIKIDVATLTGADRVFTCAAADWLSKQTLADGAPARGIKYSSKHGSDLTCRAIWIPVESQDMVIDAVAKFAWVATEKEIRAEDSHLRWAALQLDIAKVW
jgi:hypothetical protein